VLEAQALMYYFMQVKSMISLNWFSKS
jgi:hypothetical protein